MRADFYAKCAANAELAAAFSDHHVLVGPMTDDELRRAIERPTQLVGCELESGLVDLLMQDVRRQAGALPLLQHALLELWNKREGRRLTVKAYQEIGKLEGALQRRADATLKAFSEAEQELCRRTFLRLTQPGEGTEDTKRRASMQELVSLSGASSAEEDIVQKLTNASLLTTEGDFSQKTAFVEVAHEALIRSWPQLRKWIDADRAGLRTRTRLTEAARVWKNAGRDPADLYTGARLAVAKEWEASHPGERNADEAEFLRCSRDAQQQREVRELEAARKLADAQKERAEQAEKAQRLEAERAEEAEKRAKEQKESVNKLRRRAIVTAGAAGVALIFLVVSVFLWRKSESASAKAEEEARIAAIQRDAAEEEARRAEEQTRIAESRESRRLAAESSSALSNYPQRSLLLAVEAVKVQQPLQGVRAAAAEQSLREALGVIGGRAPYRPGDNRCAVKIKNYRSADCVVGGFRDQSIGSTHNELLLGLYDRDGFLRYIGSVGIDAKQKEAIGNLRSAKMTSFDGKQPGSHWSGEPAGPWRPVEPTKVIEVRYDHFSDGRFRHRCSLLRARYARFAKLNALKLDSRGV